MVGEHIMKEVDYKKYIDREWVESEKGNYLRAPFSTEAEIVDTPTLIIGVGGTGVNAAKTVKRKIKSLYSAEKAAKIEYLFIDTDSSSVSDINGADKLVIQNADTAILLREYKEHCTSGGIATAESILPKEISEWLDKDLSPFRVMNGAAGIRQAGRLILFLNINRVYNMLRKKIEKISEAYDVQKTRIKVHLFTGIGGGTGSGIFVDICYLIRQINTACQIQGFVFMPDVSCMKPGLHDIYKKNIKRNGYAALCEIEQLMTLEEHGERFEQKYPGNVPDVSSSFPVFDFCVIIGSKQDGRKAIATEEEIFERTANYLILELNKSEAGTHGFESAKSNFENVASVNSNLFCIKYASIGAAVWSLYINYFYSLWLNDVIQYILQKMKESNVHELAKVINGIRDEIGENYEKGPYWSEKKKKNSAQEILSEISEKVDIEDLLKSFDIKIYLLKVGEINDINDEILKDYKKKNHLKGIGYVKRYREAFNESNIPKKIEMIHKKSNEFNEFMGEIERKCREYCKTPPSLKSERDNFELIKKDEGDEYNKGIKAAAECIVDDFLENTEIWLGKRKFLKASYLSEYVSNLIGRFFEISGFATIYDFINMSAREGINSMETFFKDKILKKLDAAPLWPIKEGIIAETFTHTYKVIAHPQEACLDEWAKEWCETSDEQIGTIPNKIVSQVLMGTFAFGYDLEKFYGMSNFYYEYKTSKNVAGLHLYAGNRINWNRPIYFGNDLCIDNLKAASNIWEYWVKIFSEAVNGAYDDTDKSFNLLGNIKITVDVYCPKDIYPITNDEAEKLLLRYLTTKGFRLFRAIEKEVKKKNEKP